MTAFAVIGLLLPAAAQASYTVNATSPVSGTVGLTAIACGTSTSCVAVGERTSQFDDIAVPITNGQPGTPVPLSGGYYDGIACPTATTCIAVGYGNGPVVDTITNGTPGTPQTVSGASQLYGVACANTTDCYAVGYAAGEGVVVPIISGVPGTPVAASAQLDAVSCPTISKCFASGINNVSHHGVVDTISITSPSSPVPGSAVDAGAGLAELTSIGCATGSTSCASGGFAASGLVLPVTNGVPGRASSVSGTVHSISCVSASVCVGTSTDVYTIVGGAPAGTTTPSPAGSMFGVACVSATQCYTAGNEVTAHTGEGAVRSITYVAVRPPPPPRVPSKPKVTAKVNKHKHSAKFTFSASRASSFQCALVTLKKTHQKKPSFSACKSGKTYKHLKKGKYKFEVRGVDSAGTGPTATRSFKI